MQTHVENVESVGGGVRFRDPRLIFDILSEESATTWHHHANCRGAFSPGAGRQHVGYLAPLAPWRQ